MQNHISKQTIAPFDISVWRRESIKKRHARERHRLDAFSATWKAIEQLSQRYQWEHLYIFGSVTKVDRYSDRSDIDIGIQGLDKLLHYRFIADMNGLLGRRVDVIRLEECSFADAIRTRGIRWKRLN